LQNSKDPDYIALPRKVSQQVLRQLDNNWKSFFRSIKKRKKNPGKFKKKPSLPKYKHKTKGRNILIYTIQSISKVELKNDIVKLSNTNIQIKTKQKNIKQARIVPLLYNFYKIEIVYESVF
jgi:hypothetical protein